MRKLLTARFLFPLTTVAALGVWVACGGSDAQDVVTGDAGADAAVDKDTGSVDETPDTGAKDTGADVFVSPVRDAGPRIILDGGDEGGIPCFEGGELEMEPNNTKLTANVLKPIRCGVVRVPDAGEADTDWMTFTVGDASTGFRVQYEGTVTVEVETDGQAPVDITQPDAKLIFKKGQPYFVRVRSADGKTQLWKVVLFEDK